MSLLIQVVVGELEFVEGTWLLHPVGARGRGIRVDVESSRHMGFCLASDHPLRVMVLVAAVINWHNVNQQDVLGMGVQAFKGALEDGKHPPKIRCYFIILIL